MSEVRPDTFYAINLHDNDTEFEIVVNAKYDRMDLFKGIGKALLKVFDDDRGMILSYVDMETAQRLNSEAYIPFLRRDFIYETEYNLYVTAAASELTDELFGIDVDEADIYRQIQEERKSE